MIVSTQLEKTESSLGLNYFLVIDAEQAIRFIDGENRRVICNAGNGVVFHCALMPDGKGNFQIFVNQERRSRLGWVLGQLVQVEIEKDQAKYGLPISDELSEVLLQEQEGSALFERLTPGKQRTLIHWSDNVKNPEIRIRRALVMVRHLMNQRGEVDFKLLNQEMKEENQRNRKL